MILLDKAIQYAQDVLDGTEITTKEVKKQCEIFVEEYNIKQHQEDFEFYFDLNELHKIEDILKLLNFATGLGVIGTPILNGLHNFQAFFIANIFGWRFKNDSVRFRYRDTTLFIPRKNAKTFIVAVILLILMLTEDKYSEFYSICKDRELATEVKKAMTQIIQASPYVSKHFKITTTLSGKITCNLTQSYYQARTADANANNAIRPSAFIADEVGAFKDYKNIKAMESGQLSVRNPLRFKITTAYAETESIMIHELDYIKKVYKGDIVDDRMFALIYYAEDEHKWDDIGLQQSNPLRIEANYEEIKDSRAKAWEKPHEQAEFLTKHMNIFLQNNIHESYIELDKWKQCRVDKIDFGGKEVVIGVDASLTTDLTAVSMMYKENGKYYLKVHAFLPEETLKNRREKIDYWQMQQQGYCTIMSGHTINYNDLDSFIREISSKYNCTIKAIASDPYNITAMMQKLGEEYDVVLLKQTYNVLSPAIKGFRDDVYLSNIFYEKNELLDWNISNTTTVVGRTSGDVLLNKVNKNKTRIDMVMASVFSYSQLYLEDDTPLITYNSLVNFYG